MHSTTIQVISYITLMTYAISIVAINETTQIVDSQYHNPYVFRYIVTVQKALIGVLAMMIWKLYRSYFGLSTNIMKIEKGYSTILWLCIYCISSAIICYIAGLMGVISSEKHMTTVPTNDAIGRIEPVPVLILSVLFLKEKLTVWKIMAIIFTLLGIVFYVLELSSSNHLNEISNKTYDTPYGIILAITSMIGYSFGWIIVQKLFDDCYENDKFMIASICSITLIEISSSILFGWSLFYPQEIDINLLTQNAFVWIVSNGGVNLLLAVCGFVGVALTSPFYVSIASMLSLPLAFVVDVYIHDYRFNWYAISGAVFLIISFLMLKMDSFCMWCNGKRNKPIALIKNSCIQVENDSDNLLCIADNKNAYGAISRDF